MNPINQDPINFSTEQWENIILHNHSPEVKDFVNSMNDKNPNLLKYDVEKKTINYGVHNLSLSILLNPSNVTGSSTIQSFNKQNVRNLAECLKISFIADRIEGIEKIEKGKRKHSSDKDINKRPTKTIKSNEKNNKENEKSNIEIKNGKLTEIEKSVPLIETNPNAGSITSSKKQTKVVPLKESNGVGSDKIEGGPKTEKGKRKHSSDKDINIRPTKTMKKIEQDNTETKKDILTKTKNIAPSIKIIPNTELKKSEKKQTKIVPLNKLSSVQKISNKNLSKKLALEELNKKLILAINQGNIKEIKRLLVHGADINFLDINGRSLLHLAVRRNHPAVVQLLIENGANINFLDKSDYSLLFLALETNYSGIVENPLLLSTLKQNNMEIIRLLLENGANPNFVDKNGVTLLMKAADSGDLEVCKMLVSHGADLNLKDSEGQTLLMRMVSKKILNPEAVNILKYILESDNIDVNIKNNLNQSPYTFLVELLDYPEIFIKLVEKGMDVTEKDGGKSIITFLKYFRPKNYQEIIKSILKLHPHLKNEHKVLDSRVQVSHSWHLDGSTSLTNSKGSSDVLLLGGRSPIWFHQMSKNLSQFMINHPDAIDHPERFRDALIRASNSSQLTNEQKLECIKKTEALFIHTGFNQHAVTLLIWGKRFIICNLGAGMRKRIESFHFNPNLLTTDHLNMLNEIKDDSLENYNKLFFEKLVEELGFEKEPIDDYLEALSEENLELQTVGNCSWTSPMASIFAFFILDSFTEGLSGEKLNETILKNIKTYHQWDRFQKITSLEKMLKLTGELGYNTDFSLINRVDGKAKEDPLLDEQLSTLMKTYEMAILAQMMSEKMSIDEPKK